MKKRETTLEPVLQTQWSCASDFNGAILWEDEASGAELVACFR